MGDYGLVGKQTHIIKKQVLDVTLDSDVGSFSLQSELGRIYHEDMVPLIDEYCNLLSNDDEIIRIDKLEIDLGNIDKKAMRRELVKNLKKDLNRKLNQVLLKKEEQKMQNYQEDQPAGNISKKENKLNISQGSDFTLLEFFLEKGQLPWWVVKNKKVNLRDIMEKLVKENSDKLKDMILRVVQTNHQIKRLIYQFSDTVLEQILKLYTHEAPFFNELVTQTLKMDILTDDNALELKYSLWKIILTNLSTNEILPEKTFKNVVEHISKNYDKKYDLVYENLRKTMEKNGYQLPLKKEQSKDEAYHKEMVQFIKKLINGFKQIQNMLEQALTSNELDTDKKTLLNKIIAELKNKIQKAEGIKTQNQLEPEKPIISSEVQKAADIKMFQQQKKDLEDFFTKLTNELISIFDVPPADKEKFKDSLSQMMTQKDNKEEILKTQKADKFSDSEEIYIQNAGLVLAWPYLDSLFKTAGLVKEGAFIGKKEQEQALGLLHYMVYGTKEYAEHDCVLDKILCSVELEEPVYTNHFFKGNEYEECNRLCAALIFNWPAVKDMSVPALREMFLKREGVLVWQGSNWLLRIEQKTHDILLNQLPWSINVIKLPWMEKPLMVEWRL